MVELVRRESLSCLDHKVTIMAVNYRQSAIAIPKYEYDDSRHQHADAGLPSLSRSGSGRRVFVPFSYDRLYSYR